MAINRQPNCKYVIFFSQNISKLLKVVQYYELNRLSHVVLAVEYLHWIYRFANLDRFGNLHKDSEVSTEYFI